MANQLTCLETSVGYMMQTFIKKQGQDGKLTKAQFLALLKEELPSFVKQAGDAGEELFTAVDVNEDGTVDFKEFMMLIASYAWAHFELFQEIFKQMDAK